MHFCANMEYVPVLKVYLIYLLESVIYLFSFPPRVLLIIVLNVYLLKGCKNK